MSGSQPLRSLPRPNTAHTQESLPSRPRLNNYLWLPVAVIVALDIGFAVVARHVLHTAGYAPAGRLPELLPWALTVNICFFVLILLFALPGKWRVAVYPVLNCGVLLSALLFFLPRTLRLPRTEERLYVTGLMYVVFLLSLACFATSYALSNAQLASRRSLRVWLLAVSMLVYAGTTGWMNVCWQLTGDEPHYLLLTYSLVHDHDFDLSNNYAHEDYLVYFPWHMAPETVPGRNGTAMLWHDVGFPLMMVPGYAWAGWKGAMLTVNLVTAWLALGIFEVAVELGATLPSAVLVWGLFAFFPPLIIYNSMLYPETAGVGGALWTVLLFSAFVRQGQRKYLWRIGTILALLPWLCIRYWMHVGPLLVVIGLFILIHHRARFAGDFVALVLPLCLSVALFAWFDAHHFGTVLPNAGYLRVAAVYPQYTHVQPITGLLGLMFDRMQGLLPVAPIYVCALAGLLPAWKKAAWPAAAIVAASFSYLIFMACDQYWHGGGCPPARYALGGVVLWAPAAALVLRRGKQRWLIGVTALWSALMAIAYVGFPSVRALNLVDPATSQLDLLVRMHFKFSFDVVFPSLIRGGRSDYILAAVWVFLTAAYVWLLNWGIEREPA